MCTAFLVSGRSPERGGWGHLAAGKGGPQRVSSGLGVMVGGTRPSGPCCLSLGPGEDTAPHPLAMLRLGTLSLWPRLEFLSLRIPRKAPGGPAHPDQRRLSWAHLCPPRPPPSGSQASSWGLRGGPPPLPGIGDAPSVGPSTDVGSPCGPRTGPLALLPVKGEVCAGLCPSGRVSACEGSRCRQLPSGTQGGSSTAHPPPPRQGFGASDGPRSRV